MGTSFTRTSIRTEESVFLQRVEGSSDGFGVPRDGLRRSRSRRSRTGSGWIGRLRFSDYVPRIALFASKLPACLYDIWRAGGWVEFRAHIPLIVSNHEDHQEIADDFDVEFHLPVNGHEAEQEASRNANGYRVADGPRRPRALHAGAEHGVGGPLPGRIINIHHSFLPAFAGAKPYHQAHERGVKIIGATAHYVTPGWTRDRSSTRTWRS